LQTLDAGGFPTESPSEDPMSRIAKLTLYVVACALAAALCLSVVGCEAPTTPAETAEIEQLDARIDLATKHLDELEAQAKDQAKLLADGDPANDAAAVEELEAIHADYMAKGEALQADLAARGKIIDEASNRVTQPVAGGLAAMFPQWSPLILAGGALATRLITKRSRDHLLASFKALGKANVADFVGGLLKSLGYAHSNEDPLLVLEGAEAAARKRGDDAEAERIRYLAQKIREDRAAASKAVEA